MYNSHIPDPNDLPSSRQLLVSTLIALIAAGLLLIAVILPAEYGIDPTGVGEGLGLKSMGEIKMQLAEEARQEEAAPQDTEIASVTDTAVTPGEQATAETEDVVTAEDTEVQAIAKSETISVTLKPGDAAEVKVALGEKQSVAYLWNVDTGHVNYDTHGDNAQINYHNYNKGKASTADEGELAAAFDGKHGWFWRNRSDETVTVTLKVTGDFGSLERVL